MRVFIAGTDTGVGKTFVSARLLQAIRESGQSCAGFKPIACGDREDAEALLQAGTPGISIDLINPVWLKTPAAPLVASKLERCPIDFDQIARAFRELCNSVEHLVIEGAGGWLTPISPGRTMADLAAEFECPVLLVALNRLGALNHTLLTLESIAAKKITVTSMILNNLTSTSGIALETNFDVLRSFISPVPVFELEQGVSDLPEELLWQLQIHSVK